MSLDPLHPPQWERLAQLLSAIPQDVLANAALGVGANARALMYYESYVREKQGGALNPAALTSVHYSDQHVSFLQEVYGRLEDPDGLEGVVMLRKGGPTLRDRLVSAHNTGRWAEALAMHQQLQRQAREALRDAGGGGGGGTTKGQHAHPGGKGQHAHPGSKRVRHHDDIIMMGHEDTTGAYNHPHRGDTAGGDHGGDSEAQQGTDAQQQQQQQKLDKAMFELAAAQHGALTCMLHMGHFEAVCSMVDGNCVQGALAVHNGQPLDNAMQDREIREQQGNTNDNNALNTHPDTDDGAGHVATHHHHTTPPAAASAATAWASYGVAACWRLGQWGALEGYAGVVERAGEHVGLRQEGGVQGVGVDSSAESVLEFDGAWEVCMRVDVIFYCHIVMVCTYNIRNQ